MKKMTAILKKKALQEIRDIKVTALDVQVGGDHYRTMKIQPVEFSHKNNLNYCQGNVVKYLCRYKTKNGKADLEKAKHYIDLLIDMEYGHE